MNDAITQYENQFAALFPDFSAGEPDWMMQQRTRAMTRLRQNGFPSQRDEDWRYMPMRSLTAKAFDTNIDGCSASVSLDPWPIPHLKGHRFVFVDGVLQGVHSSDQELPQGISVRSLAQVIRQVPEELSAVMTEEPGSNHGFLALNTAFFRDGYLVDVAAGHESDRVLEFIFVSAGQGKAVQARNLLRVGAQAKVRVIERHVSSDGLNTLVNISSRIILKPGSTLEYDLVETPGKGVNLIDDMVVAQSRDSHFRILTATLGGDIVRNNLQVRMSGPGAHCEMLGLYVTYGRQHVDNHTHVVHAAPHCSSRELYKGVMDKRSRGVFHGRIRVEPGAVHTDASQSNHNLLLSPDVEIDTKPQLEIYADDVQCSHGATVGQLDDQALFYLRSRGIDQENARSLLTYGFVHEVLENCEIQPLRDFLEDELSRRLISHE